MRFGLKLLTLTIDLNGRMLLLASFITGVVFFGRFSVDTESVSVVVFIVLPLVLDQFLSKSYDQS
jgi:hypothetical protein